MLHKSGKNYYVVEWVRLTWFVLRVEHSLQNVIDIDFLKNPKFL